MVAAYSYTWIPIFLFYRRELHLTGVSTKLAREHISHCYNWSIDRSCSSVYQCIIQGPLASVPYTPIFIYSICIFLCYKSRQIIVYPLLYVGGSIFILFYLDVYWVHDCQTSMKGKINNVLLFGTVIGRWIIWKYLEIRCRRVERRCRLENRTRACRVQVPVI